MCVHVCVREREREGGRERGWRERERARVCVCVCVCASIFLSFPFLSIIVPFLLSFFRFMVADPHLFFFYFLLPGLRSINLYSFRNIANPPKDRINVQVLGSLLQTRVDFPD